MAEMSRAELLNRCQVLSGFFEYYHHNFVIRGLEPSPNLLWEYLESPDEDYVARAMAPEVAHSTAERRLLATFFDLAKAFSTTSSVPQSNAVEPNVSIVEYAYDTLREYRRWVHLGRVPPVVDEPAIVAALSELEVYGLLAARECVVVKSTCNLMADAVQDCGVNVKMKSLDEHELMVLQAIVEHGAARPPQARIVEAMQKLEGPCPNTTREIVKRLARHGLVDYQQCRHWIDITEAGRDQLVAYGRS